MIETAVEAKEGIPLGTYRSRILKVKSYFIKRGVNECIEE
jgi:hypothetical protein